ncbi:MAG: replicative DNA helicase [Patescibacteria group bacterium]
MKVPPHDIEAEKSVLGAILIDTSSIGLVAQFLKSEHFYTKSHTLIYEAMILLFEKQLPIDAVTLKNELKIEGNLAAAGGQSYIADLLGSVPTAANVEEYAKIVRNHAVKRKLIEISSRAVEQAFDDTKDTQEMLDHIESEIFAVAEETSTQEFMVLKDLLAESYQRLEDLSKSDGHLRGVPTGIPDLDIKLAGMHPSNLLILAARPGVGKTSLALNMGLHAALRHKMGVAVFSLEMSKEELVDRLLVSHADIDAWRLKTGRLSPEDSQSIINAMGELAEAPIFIDDTAGQTILEMRTKARKLKANHDIKLIIVDYLQLVNPGKKIDSREQQVSYVSQNLKNLARELRVPVLTLSQLNRMVEQRGTKKPQLADLRESGSIEQDADVVMFIYSEQENDDLVDPSKKMMKLSIAKHRNGGLADIDLLFRGDRVKFYGVEKTLDL